MTRVPAAKREAAKSMVLDRASFELCGGPRLIGRIVRIHEGKGFGFIRVENGPEYFVHVSELADRDLWREEQKVIFTAGPAPPSRRAPRAYSVQGYPDAGVPGNQEGDENRGNR